MRIPGNRNHRCIFLGKKAISVQERFFVFLRNSVMSSRIACRIGIHKLVRNARKRKFAFDKNIPHKARDIPLLVFRNSACAGLLQLPDNNEKCLRVVAENPERPFGFGAAFGRKRKADFFYGYTEPTHPINMFLGNNRISVLLFQFSYNPPLRTSKPKHAGSGTFSTISKHLKAGKSDFYRSDGNRNRNDFRGVFCLS